MAVVMFAVVVFAALAGFGGAHWTGAVFTNTQAVTGNTFGTATLTPPAGLGVTANAGKLDLAWTATTSLFAEGYYVYRAAASGGPYGNSVAKIVGRLNITWTDATPPAGTNFYKLTAYRANWLSAETPVSSGATGPQTLVVNYFYTTGDLQRFTVPAGVTSLHIVAKGEASSPYSGGIATGDVVVIPGQVMNILLKIRTLTGMVDADVSRQTPADWLVKAGGANTFTDENGSASYNATFVNPGTAQMGGSWGAATVSITYTIP